MPVAEHELHHGRSDLSGKSAARPVQPPLFNYGPTTWDRAHHLASLRDIGRSLAANVGWELTAEHGWRIVTISAEARRALDMLDVYEGEVIPDPVMRERRRRVVEADLMLEQARAVLRTVQAELEAGAA